MNWECQQCQHSLNVQEGTVMRFCPKCGVCQNVPLPESSAEAESNNCPVCYTEIILGDEMINCPDCKMVYHADCWNDNNGCAVYGCHSAGCLNLPPMKINLDLDGENDVPHQTYQNTPRGQVCSKCHTPRDTEATSCRACGNEFKSSKGDILIGVVVILVFYILKRLLEGKQ